MHAMQVINGYEFIKNVKDMIPLVEVFPMRAFKIDDIEFRKKLPFVKVGEIIVAIRQKSIGCVEGRATRKKNE
jgi:hypothetical protein